MDDLEWPTSRKRLLEYLSEQLQVPPERIEATDVWRGYSGSKDSLGIVELLLGLESELFG